jgi:hypothetical protein
MFPVKDGRPKSSELIVWADATSTVPPVHMNGNVRELVRLTADWGQIYDLNAYSRTGADGQPWYVFSGSIDATYYSASTKYTLVMLGKIVLTQLYQRNANNDLKGKRYDTVTAELV